MPESANDYREHPKTVVGEIDGLIRGCWGSRGCDWLAVKATQCLQQRAVLRPVASPAPPVCKSILSVNPTSWGVKLVLILGYLSQDTLPSPLPIGSLSQYYYTYCTTSDGVHYTS